MMESLETGTCLWMVTNRNIFGFLVKNLELLGKNDASDSKPILSPLRFDFNLKLPEPDLRPFFFESKLFFASGSPGISNALYQLFYTGGTTLDIAEVEPAGAIPLPPTSMYQCKVANIQGDVYLLVHDPMTQDSKLGFWVLRSGSNSKQWLHLPPPPPLRYYCRSDKPPFVYLTCWDSFVWKDKLYLMAFFNSQEIKYPDDKLTYVYDPKNARKDDCWQRIENPFSGLVRLLPPYIAVVPSLGKVGNCDVALTWLSEEYDPTYTSDVKIYALLIDDQDNVLRQECLDELCGAIPFSFARCSMDVNFVDLGEGKVCVLIGGVRAFLPNPILCVIVLKLGLVQEEGQRFLSLDVLVNRVYDMEPYTLGNRFLEVPQSSFLSSFNTGMPFKHPYSQGSNSPGKKPKLASGTNPTSPRALWE